MLTFEKVLEIFEDYLAQDMELEVYKSRYGYVCVSFNGSPPDPPYCEGDVCRTPEELFDHLLVEYESFASIQLTKGRREENEGGTGPPSVPEVFGSSRGGYEMTALKLILKIVIAPVILLLTLAIWICVGLVYVSGLVLGLLSTVIALLGVAVLVTYSPQNGLILLVIAFLISPFGLPKLAFWLLGKVQDLKFTVQNVIYR